MSGIRIALIGDYSPSVTANVRLSPQTFAIPRALELAAKALNVDVQPAWIHTSKVAGAEEIHSLHSYQAIW